MGNLSKMGGNGKTGKRNGTRDKILRKNYPYPVSSISFAPWPISSSPSFLLICSLRRSPMFISACSRKTISYARCSVLSSSTHPLAQLQSIRSRSSSWCVTPTKSPTEKSCDGVKNKGGFTLNIIDTPGLIEGGYVNDIALELIKRFLLNKTIDVLLYVDHLDAYRVDNLDKLVAKAITNTFGKEIWNKALIALTHAQFSPPDGLPYDEFFSKRSEALLKVVRLDALKKKDASLVLPNGTAWIPHLAQNITEIALNKHASIYADKKLIEGPNTNERGKLWISLVFALQYFFIMKPIKGFIKGDIADQSRSSWETHERNAGYRKRDLF